jgi:hypothetical protein
LLNPLFWFKQQSNAKAPQLIEQGAYRRIIGSSTKVRGNLLCQPMDMRRKGLSEIGVISSLYDSAEEEPHAIGVEHQFL